MDLSGGFVDENLFFKQKIRDECQNPCVLFVHTTVNNVGPLTMRQSSDESAKFMIKNIYLKYSNTV